MTWLLYALGGGWGHLNRSVALGRLAAQRHPVTILTNSPYAQHFQYPELTWEIIPAATEFQPTCDRVRQVVQQCQPTCLIVDTFPRGLGGELADLLPRHFCVLTHRDLTPAYVQAKQLDVFVRNHFSLVLIPGETPESLPLTGYQTAPWLIRNAEELPDWVTARSRLGVDPTQRLVIVLASGQPEELQRYGTVADAIAHQFPTIAVRCLAPVRPPTCPPDLWTFHAPALDCLWAADLVVGSAGYNTFYECQSSGVPLVALPAPRLYDRQLTRLQQGLRQSRGPWVVRGAQELGEVLAAVGELLQSERPRTPPQFENGAIAALTLIEQTLSLRPGIASSATPFRGNS